MSVVTMESRKVSLFGYVVLIVLHLTLSHSPEGQTRTEGAPGLSGDSAGSTELIKRCNKIDEKSLIILCGTHCQIKISEEFTDITQIDNGTWLNSQDSFANTPNRCNCCKTEMPFTENPTNNGLPMETKRVFSSFGGSGYDDDYYKQLRIVQDELYPFLLISIIIITFLIFGLGFCYVLIFSMCLCCRPCYSRGKKVVKTRPILISSCSSGDSIMSTMIDCEYQVEPKKDKPPSHEDFVSVPFTTPDSQPAAVQVTAL